MKINSSCYRLITIFTVLLILFLLTQQLRLVLIQDESGRGFSVLTSFLWKAKHFSLQWTHSLEKVKIEEVYRVDRDNFHLEETRIEDFVPAPWLEEDFSHMDDEWVARWAERRMQSISIRIGTVADQMIITKKKTMPLSDIGRSKDLVRIKVVGPYQVIYAAFRAIASNEGN